MTGAEEKPFTLAADPAVEARARDVLAALVSALEEALAPVWVGAALGGAPAFGEGATVRGEDGVARLGDPLDLLVVVEAPVREEPALTRRAQGALARTARSRRAEAGVRVAARDSLPYLPATLENREVVAASRVLAGPPGLLGTARCGEVGEDDLLALRLLVRRGAALVRAETDLDSRVGVARAPARALHAVRNVDLALGAAILLSAGRWTAGEEARSLALRTLAGGETPAGGFHTRLSWTRFRDLVDRHHAAFHERATPDGEVAAGEARKQTARAADRFLEVLRLSEEDRIATPLPNWTAYTKALAARRPGPSSASLFPAFAREAEAGIPPRRKLRQWPGPERLAPALAALLDWDPGDLAVAPALLDLPAGAPREALRARLLALAAEV